MMRHPRFISNPVGLSIGWREEIWERASGGTIRQTMTCATLFGIRLHRGIRIRWRSRRYVYLELLWFILISLKLLILKTQFINFKKYFFFFRIYSKNFLTHIKPWALIWMVLFLLKFKLQITAELRFLMNITRDAILMFQ